MRRKSEDKRRRIAEAAVRVFARDGFHKAMISRIADEAGVGTGSVYLYFEGKEDILQHLLSGLWERLHQMFERVVNDDGLDPGEKIEALIDGVFFIFERDPSLAQIFVHEQPRLVRDGTGGFMAFYEEFLAMGAGVFKEGIDSGSFKPSLDPSVFTYVVLGALRQLLNQWARAPRDLPLETLQVQLKGIIMGGVRA